MKPVIIKPISSFTSILRNCEKYVMDHNYQPYVMGHVTVDKILNIPLSHVFNSTDFIISKSGKLYDLVSDMDGHFIIFNNQSVSLNLVFKNSKLDSSEVVDFYLTPELILECQSRVLVYETLNQ